jgi:hypothetical protein
MVYAETEKKITQFFYKNSLAEVKIKKHQMSVTTQTVPAVTLKGTKETERNLSLHIRECFEYSPYRVLSNAL